MLVLITLSVPSHQIFSLPPEVIKLLYYILAVAPGNHLCCQHDTVVHTDTPPCACCKPNGNLMFITIIKFSKKSDFLNINATQILDDFYIS